MNIFYQIVCLASVVFTVRSGEHLYAHGPFGKAHLAVEKPDPIHCSPTLRFVSRSAHPASSVITKLDVSATTYSNFEKIHVSWLPLSSGCKDDFIGIYLVETPQATGKSSTYMY